MTKESEVDASIHLKFNALANELRLLHQTGMLVGNGYQPFGVDDTVPGRRSFRLMECRMRTTCLAALGLPA